MCLRIFATISNQLSKSLECRCRWRLKVSIGSIVLVCLIAGCDRPTLAEPIHQNIYSTDSIAIPPSHTVSLINEIGGDIVVVTGGTDQMIVEVTATSTSNSTEEAIVEAESQITTTSKLLRDGTREIKVYRTGKPDDDDQVLLHIEIPAGTVLSNITNKSGDIHVYGNIGDVTATTNSGDIYLMGGNGNAILETSHGSIVADMLPHQNLLLIAADGDITITARDASVTATATNGSISFSGDFHNPSDDQLTTTGEGNIHVAVLDPSPYRVYATSVISSDVISDFSPAATLPVSLTEFAVCGFIHSSAQTDRSQMNTNDHFGRIEVMPALSGTQVYTGMLSAAFYRFETNQTHLKFFMPEPYKVYTYDEPQINQIHSGKLKIDPACQQALADNESVKFTLYLRTDTGRIQIHQIVRRP
jgi:hypothetical protein